MIVDITQEIFEQYCPFARDVRGSKIFANYYSELRVADTRLCNLMLGMSLHRYLSQHLTDEEHLPDYAKVLIPDLQRYLCNEAAWRSAGKNDLVQTVHGFGTVSGQQELVASAARVNAMRVACRKSAVEAWDSLADTLASIHATLYKTVGKAEQGPDEAQDEAELAKLREQQELLTILEESQVWRCFNRHIVTTNTELQRLTGTGDPSDLRDVDSLEKYSWYGSSVEGKVRHIAGRDVFNRIFDNMLHGVASMEEREAVERMRLWLAAAITNEGSPIYAEREKDLMVDVMNTHVDKFPGFEETLFYQGLHTPTYESEKEDPSYWL